MAGADERCGVGAGADNPRVPDPAVETLPARLFAAIRHGDIVVARAIRRAAPNVRSLP